MCEDKQQQLIGCLGIVYDNGHLTIYKNNDKALNASGADRLVMVIGFKGDNPIVIDHSLGEEFPIKKVKVK